MQALETSAKAETVFALGQRFWDVCKYFGIDTPIKLAIGGLVMAAWAWFMTLLQSAPLWVVVLSSLAAATLFSHLLVAVQRVWFARGQKTLDVRAFGAECLKFYQDVGAVMSAQLPVMRPAVAAPTPEAMHAEWQANVEQSRRRDALLLERFGARAFAIAHLFKVLGIPEPNMFHFAHGDAGGAAVYIGVVGELLCKGRLAEARQLDPRSTWGASFR